MKDKLELIDLYANRFSYMALPTPESTKKRAKELLNTFINDLKSIEPVRFIMPTDKQLIEIALLFNNGKIAENKLMDMMAMSKFIIDRLYENGNISKPSSKEKK